jgi:hypothetical protein
MGRVATAQSLSWGKGVRRAGGALSIAAVNDDMRPDWGAR